MNNSAPDLRAIFDEMLDLDSPADRARHLAEACGDDSELRSEVEGLMKALGDAGSFLEQPPPDLTIEHLPAPAAEGAGSMVGPYRLMEQIGEGGMGVVYVAEQSQPVRRKVALKLIKPGMDTRQVIARFEAERQALAMMDHPNIAKIHDGGATEAGRPYFIMELVRGVPITDYCDEQRITIRGRLELFVLVCRAVQHAHQKGVIHRDLKPSNILVTLHDGVPVPKVIDFGVAKATGASLTERTLHTGFAQMLGTPLYMSPEQAELSGMDIDTRSDIYSLGVLLYELLTGTTPFDGESLKKAAFDEMRRIIREEEPPKPSTRLSSLGERLSSVSASRKADPRRLGPSLSGELDWVVMKALEKDRRRRYETAGDFAADVMRYLTHRPVEAFPPSTWYRIAKYARRNRTALTTVALLGLALAAGTAVSVWQAIKATRAERRAEARSHQARRAVDKMYTQVAEKWLADQPSLEPIQREFLEEAARFYATFAQEDGTDPDVQLESARASYRLGLIHYKLGEYDRVEPAYRRAIVLQMRLAAEHPASLEPRNDLATSLDALAVYLRNIERRPEAEELHKQAVAVWEDLVAIRPGSADLRRALALGYKDLFVAYADAGVVSGDVRFFELAWVPLRRAFELREALAADSAATDEDRHFLARVYGNRGWLCFLTNRLAEAEAAERRCLEMLTALADRHPNVPRYRLDQAGVLGRLAHVLWKTGGHEEAERHLRRGLEINERLAAESPDIPLYRQRVAGSFDGMGEFFPTVGHYAEAAQARRRCLAIFQSLRAEFPTIDYARHVARQQRLLARLLARCPDLRVRDPREAVRLAESAVDLNPRDGESWRALGLARYYAGDGKAALKALQASLDLNRGGTAGDWFVLSMAHWKEGHKDRARAWYKKAVAWMERNRPRDEELLRFRAEADAVLGHDGRPNSPGQETASES